MTVPRLNVRPDFLSGSLGAYVRNDIPYNHESDLLQILDCGLAGEMLRELLEGDLRYLSLDNQHDDHIQFREITYPCFLDFL